MMPPHQPLRTIRLVAVPMLVLVLAGSAAGQRADDEQASRRFTTGLEFARDGRYREALTDFEAVVERFPASPVADNALLEIARYYLEVAADLDQAAEYARRIVDAAEYSQQDAAPEAYIVLARADMARGRASEDLDAALAQLERGLGIWPDSPMVPQSRFFIGDANRRAGRFAEALEAYDRVTAEHAETVWAARARLDAAVLRAINGDPVTAMSELQQVRDDWPDSPEAETALERVTILYRLYVRPGERAFATAGDSFSTRGRPRIEQLLVTREGQTFFANSAGVGAIDPAAAVLAPAGGRPRGLVLDRRGTVLSIVDDS